jgi:hypothetical protein
MDKDYGHSRRNDMSVQTRRHIPDMLMAAPAPSGGEVAALQRVLEDRLGLARPAEAAQAWVRRVPLDERLVRLVSHVLGYVLLAAGFLVIAAIIF